MKKAYLFILIPLLFAGFSFNYSNGFDSSNDSTSVLKPDPLHFDESIVITSILNRYHYRQITLNDSLSSAIFDRYLSSMDYSKLYFLKSDIDSFEDARYNIDDYLKAGKVDVAIMGGLQVDEQGNFANWAVPGKPLLGVGGAMDLASGASRLIVTMTHCDKQGNSKIVKACNLPLTAKNAVDVLITDLAFFEV